MSRTRFARVATVGLLVLLTLGSLVAGSAVAVAAGTGDAVPSVAAQDDEGGMDNETDDGMNESGGMDESDGMDDDSGMDNSSDDGMNDSGGMDDDGEMNDEMSDEMSDEMDGEDDGSALGTVELIGLGLAIAGSVGAVGYYYVSN